MNETFSTCVELLHNRERMMMKDQMDKLIGSHNPDDEQPYLLACPIDKEEAIKELVDNEGLSNRIKVAGHPCLESGKVLLIDRKKLDEEMTRIKIDEEPFKRIWP